MKPVNVTEAFAVSPQLKPEDMQELAEAGYRTVICNRPDGEEPGQPALAVMRETAKATGIAFHHIPVAGGEFPEVAVRAFARVREEADGKVLAFCRSGTRSITLDALANIDNSSADVRIERAQRAGFDLTAMRDRLGQ